MAALKLEQICKRYGAVQVIPDLSLDVASGEFIVFLGPSGCGKTSLLRMIAGLEEVTAGRILIGGQDVTQAAPGQRELAMVFQHYALYPHMTVRDNLAFGLRNTQVAEDEIERRIREAARMLELDALRGRTRLELAQLHRRLGATMVFVTHDQIEAMTLATRIVVMNAGRIEQVAAPSEVYRRPATRFVAGFIGTPGMNFVPVRRLADRDGVAVVTLPDGQSLATRVPGAAVPGASLTLGVRPEHLLLAADGPLQAVVEMVEFLGERTLAHVRLADGTLAVATVPGNGVGFSAGIGASPAVGEAVTLALSLDEVHLFGEDGRAHHAAAGGTTATTTMPTATTPDPSAERTA